ncbi:hypothetical protein D3C73_1593500 [compost metagenome]
MHLAKTVFSSSLDQMFHQQSTQAQMLPFVGNRYCAFTFMLARGRVAADADLDQLAVFVHQ